MQDPLRFRRELAARILGLLGAASLGACNGGGAKSTGTHTVTTTHTTATTTSTTALPDAGMGGAGGAGGASTGGGGMGGADLNPPLMACFSLPIDAGADVIFDAGAAPGMCPTDSATAINDFAALGCPDGWEPVQIVSGPTMDATGACCYMVHLHLCGPGGRPFLVAGGTPPVTAAAERSAGARDWAAGDGPLLQGLTSAQRASLAAAWTADALSEHASVASFARFSLALMAAGAPADLVHLAHLAALDEVRHARLCFTLASAYAGEDIAPGPFPLGGAVQVDANLAALAASTVAEGCIGETLAALVAAEQLAHATDPAVRAALAEIAADEARHAELAWRTVAWAVQAGGAEVRAAVKEAFASTLAATSAPPAETIPPGPTAAHGLLDAATKARVVASALAEVVAPSAAALLRGWPISGARAGVVDQA